jgi:hypothetical protein
MAGLGRKRTIGFWRARGQKRPLADSSSYVRFRPIADTQQLGHSRRMTDVAPLLPELREWNNGRGITPFDWLYCIAHSDAAVAYSQLFWPSFVRFEKYILREGLSEQAVREWEGVADPSRETVEAAVNTVHLDDLFFRAEDWSPLVAQRAIHLGRTLCEIYRIKLAHDFPGVEFELSLFDGSQEGGEISLSFWQSQPEG